MHDDLLGPYILVALLYPKFHRQPLLLRYAQDFQAFAGVAQTCGHFVARHVSF